MISERIRLPFGPPADRCFGYVMFSTWSALFRSSYNLVHKPCAELEGGIGMHSTWGEAIIFGRQVGHL